MRKEEAGKCGLFMGLESRNLFCSVKSALPSNSGETDGPGNVLDKNNMAMCQYEITQVYQRVADVVAIAMNRRSVLPDRNPNISTRPWSQRQL